MSMGTSMCSAMWLKPERILRLHRLIYKPLDLRFLILQVSCMQHLLLAMVLVVMASRLGLLMMATWGSLLVMRCWWRLLVMATLRVLLDRRLKAINTLNSSRGDQKILVRTCCWWITLPYWSTFCTGTCWWGWYCCGLTFGGSPCCGCW